MWLTATEALDRLGTKPQSLYASVSRGRIRARPDPADERRSLYSAEDVERLAQRGAGRRRTETVASEAIRWGDPVLETGISTVAAGRLIYRGHDAATLAETATLEDVAELLWDGPAAIGDRPADVATGSIAAVFGLLARHAATDAPSFGRGQTALRREAGDIVSEIGAALCATGAEPLHRRLAARWGRPEAADLLRSALVLLADHELNASALAARVAASAGASLAAGTLAGLCTLTGPLHGTSSTAVFGLAARARATDCETAIRGWLAEGRAVPAFGHRLYPDGDVRAEALLMAFEPPAIYAELAAAGERIVGERPNVDFALAALSEALGQPPSAPLELFTLARSVGWLAHMLEQAAQPGPIRPRARYTGVTGRIDAGQSQSPRGVVQNPSNRAG